MNGSNSCHFSAIKMKLCLFEMQVINRSTTELPLTVSYDKISLGKLRFWIHMQDAVYSLQQFGTLTFNDFRPRNHN